MNTKATYRLSRGQEPTANSFYSKRATAKARPPDCCFCSFERKKKQLYNLVYCKRAHFILVFLDADAGTWGEAAARLQIQFHNMQFHTQFALTKRPRTHQTLAWLTPDWPVGLEGVTLPPREPPWSERRLAKSSGARLASQKTGTCFFRSAVFHSSSKTFFAEDQHSPQPDLPTLIYLAKLL